MPEGPYSHETPLSLFRKLFLNSGLYHALYKASEYLGGETWGDNIEANTNFVQSIPEEIRHKPIFRMLLLGSATSTSIKQALEALSQWENKGFISYGKLTVIDVNPAAFLQLDPETRKKVDLIQGDVTKVPFAPSSFDFISSDYLLNFIPRNELESTISSLSELLVSGGVMTAALDTKKAVITNKLGSFFVRNGITAADVDSTVNKDTATLLAHLPAISKGLGKINNVGSDRLVWAVQKK